jgi:hypothetical protein
MKKTIEIFQKNADELHNIAAQYRGEIIANATNVETHLERIIAYYFTSSDETKSTELMHCLLSHTMFSFNTKKNLFMFIHKNKFNKIKIKGIDIERVMNLRNQMAHGKLIFYGSKLNEIVDFDNDSITFYEWKTSKNEIVTKPIKLTRKFVDNEIKHMHALMNKLREIFKTLEKDKK